MEYSEISELLEEAMDETLEPDDKESVLSDWSHKMFNQGVKLMFHTAILKIAKREQEVRSNV